MSYTQRSLVLVSLVLLEGDNYKYNCKYFLNHTFFSTYTGISSPHLKFLRRKQMSVVGALIKVLKEEDLH
jgi:hypothetical protein